MTPEAAAKRYVAFCEEMTPADLVRLGDFCAPEIRFRDPFNEVAGLEAYRRVLAKMFEDVGQPEFKVDGCALEDNICYLRWRFSFRRRGGERVTIPGMSEVLFGPDGRALRHFDYWDGGRVYELVPLLRSFIRLVKRRLSID
jgi:steroid Delta-isomerase